MKKKRLLIMVLSLCLLLAGCGAAGGERDTDDPEAAAAPPADEPTSQESGEQDAAEGGEGASSAADGKLKSIGLSNFYEPEDFDRLVNAVAIPPALLQNETHPYHQSEEMKEHIAQYGTVMESWFPLGGRGNTQRLFNDETISAIAAAHGKSSPQVIIRWHLQAGNICIPGSSNEQHIIEDYDVWDFELTEEEMAQMAALNKDERFAGY